jgi:hypothetical protein
MSSVLGHLALAFAPSPENLATEALSYVLQRSSAAHIALEHLAADLARLPHLPLIFRTQAGQSDGAIPDLVGEDSEGNQHLVIEAKFWAGLTDRQPVQYLARLPARGGLVLVLAPQLRFETLWPELLYRVASFVEEPLEPENTGPVRRARLAAGRVLALMSWDTLLSTMSAATEAAGEREHTSDLQQLRGLCEEQDAHAFRPVTASELSGDTGERIVQWCHLVNDLVSVGKERGLFPRSGTRGQGGDGYWGHYIRLGAVGVYLHFSPYKWSRLRATPLWLRIYSLPEGQWRSGVRYHDELRVLRLDQSRRPLIDRHHLEVPLWIPTGREKPVVIDEVLAQVRSVLDALGAQLSNGEPESTEQSENAIPPMLVADA